MNLTYHILLDELHLNVRDYSGNRNPDISGVELFEADNEPYNPNILYIATLHDAAQVSSSQPISFICVNGGVTPTAIITDNNIAVVEERIGLMELAHKVYFAFTRLNKWIIQMQQSVIERAGVQALLDISDDIMRTTITVMDSTYKLLAYSHDWLPDDPVNSYLIENGFHSDETMANFVKYDRFREPQNTNDIVISHDRYISDFVTVKKFFKHFNMVSVYVVMVCNHREISTGLADLFRILNHFIEYYAKKGYPYDGKYSAFDALIHEMLDKKLANPVEIEHRAERAELTFSGIFDIYKVRMAEHANLSVTYLALRLSDLIPNSRVSFYQNAIIILNTYRHTNEATDKFDFCCRILNDVAGESIHSVGKSNVFFQLDAFPVAYAQADAALQVAAMLPQSSNGILTMSFETCYIRHMLLQLCNGDDMLYSNCQAVELVKKLDEYSSIRNYDYVNFLLAYLIYERRPTDVGELLHLHRNTVVYHISKVEELLNITFDSPEMRLKLIIEIYRHLLKKNFNQEIK